MVYKDALSDSHMTNMLSKEHLEAFKDTGYTLVRGLYNSDEMKEITAWCDEVAAYPEVAGKYMMYFEHSRLDDQRRILSRIEDFEPWHRGFSRLFTAGRLKACVDDLFSESSVLFKDKINFKMPGGSGFKAHQDIQAGWDTYAPLHITALLTIDPCTLDNGCLEMAPGYHKQGIIGEKWQPLEEDALDYVAVPTAPGDAVFFDSFAPHRSGPNLTDKPRRVLYVTYNKLSDGDHRRQYYIDKRKNYPPDCEREADREYVFRV
jgi:ectoine hydroxylase-related dioxygenase (phytanoyl-CoA dioxygenase family)